MPGYGCRPKDSKDGDWDHAFMVNWNEKRVICVWLESGEIKSFKSHSGGWIDVSTGKLDAMSEYKRLIEREGWRAMSTGDYEKTCGSQTDT